MRKLFFITILVISSISLNSQNLAKTKIKTDTGIPSESYQSMTFNGSWCWFSDPRAVYFEGIHKRSYSGWVDNYGDLHIAFYDHETKEISSKVIFDKLEIDDHDNPSILFDKEGRLLVFFNRHMKGEQPLFLVKSKMPEDIGKWSEVKELYLNDENLRDLGSMNHTYTNPVRLSAENDRIYLFWRGVDGKPCFSFSDDEGESWSAGAIFFMPERIYGFRRPYTKVYSDGISRIHFVLTDGHPRKERENNIYYMFYESGAFFRANGEKICTITDLPVKPGQTDLVYDASEGEAKAWNWNIAIEENGNPVIAYAKFPDDNTHIYCYARWDGKKWNNFDLVNSGKWFPETPGGFTEPEPNYSGGMNIDKENPNILYLSVNRDSVFEIEKWSTTNGGKKWLIESITNRSEKNNVRPFAVRGASEGTEPQVLWMQNTKYLHFAYASQLKEMGGSFKDRFHSSIKMDIHSPEINDPLEKNDIVTIMKKTADWQLANPRYKINPIDWHYGAFYTGLRALYELTGKDRYLNELVNIGETNSWRPMDDIFHADRLTVIDNWAWLYDLFEDPEMIKDSRWALDIHLARNYKQATDVRFENNPNNMEWWTWCDALFMAPPSFVQMWKVTGEEKYLRYMDTQWWKTSDYLYSGSDSLYFRDDRFFDQRTENGKKIFWSRGNGWVIAGLARILSHLPGDYPNRVMFENQYREMAHKLLTIQAEDGLWRVSLLDPEYLDIGESSGSAFFTYALAWGINNGLLDKKYIPRVKKAWTALCNNVNHNGRLGFVQQVAGSPYPFYEDQSHVYATGAFLLAGKEMYKLVN
jgi:rhamnogalacturonyl hydrolase YesR